MFIRLSSIWLAFAFASIKKVLTVGISLYDSPLAHLFLFLHIGT